MAPDVEGRQERACLLPGEPGIVLEPWGQRGQAEHPEVLAVCTAMIGPEATRR